MPVEIVMPKLGLTMTSGTIARWMKQPGETVREGEPLLEVATDKINYEVEAPASGRLASNLAREGDEFECGAVIALIALEGEADTPLAAPAAAAGAPANAGTAASGDTAGSGGVVEAPRQPGSVPAAAAPTTGVPAASTNGAAANGTALNGNGRVVASPAARRLARERGVALHAVRGTGPRGRITLSDVHGAPVGGAEHVAPSAPAFGGAHAPFPPHLPPARRAIFRKMSEVGLLPLAQVETQARVDAVHALMQSRGDFGWTAFAVYALARLLREHAELRTDATTGAPFERIGIGVAADTPQGLIVPVVRDADTRSLGSIQTEIVRLAGAARSGALTPQDIGGACFSLSNVGPQKIDRVAPLPDPPQTAILGIGAVTERPAVVDGALVAARMLTCVLSFDHRFIDGAPAGRFLAAFARACAEPGMLL
jgi:pyruvate dehydrogenase E2 component (dihydrolipoamide acetyltransferase)